jgi:glycosyltransferase involved in cell wall biosynthesis
MFGMANDATSLPIDAAMTSAVRRFIHVRHAVARTAAARPQLVRLMMSKAPHRPLVLVISALPPPVHGQSWVTSRVVDALGRSGAEIKVFDISPGTLQRSVGYHAKKLAQVLKACIWAMARFHRSAHIYMTLDAGPGLVYNFIIATCGRGLGARMFLHHHTAAHLDRKHPAVDLLFRLAGRWTQHVVLSEAMAEDLRRAYTSATRVLVSHNACHVPDPGAAEFEPRSPLRLGFLSNLSAEKGFDLAISTCRAAAADGLHVRLVVAGPLTDEASEAVLADGRAALGERLDYRGPVSGQAKARFLNDIDVLLFPTRYRNEAQPLVVLEALSHGKPVVVSERGYLRELVGDAGVVVNARNYLDVAPPQLQAWAAAPETLARLSQAARARFLDLSARSGLQFAALVEALSR